MIAPVIKRLVVWFQESNGFQPMPPRTCHLALNLLMRLVSISSGSYFVFTVQIFTIKEFAASWTRGYLSGKDQKALKEW